MKNLLLFQKLRSNFATPPLRNTTNSRHSGAHALVELKATRIHKIAEASHYSAVQKIKQLQFKKKREWHPGWVVEMKSFRYVPRALAGFFWVRYKVCDKVGDKNVWPVARSVKMEFFHFFSTFCSIKSRIQRLRRQFAPMCSETCLSKYGIFTQNMSFLIQLIVSSLSTFKTSSSLR